MTHKEILVEATKKIKASPLKHHCRYQLVAMIADILLERYCPQSLIDNVFPYSSIPQSKQTILNSIKNYEYTPK